MCVTAREVKIQLSSVFLKKVDVANQDAGERVGQWRECTYIVSSSFWSDVLVGEKFYNIVASQ